MTTAIGTSDVRAWTLRHRGARLLRIDPGRPFVSLPFDYLVIGGGLSLLVMLWLASGSDAPRVFLQDNLWTLVLLSTSAHFAGSTVRLYTKRGSFQDLRFLTMGLPLVTLIVLSACLLRSAAWGGHLQSLYLTWSPYHYSAQAYGLAVMYCYRSGNTWSVGDKRLLRLACVIPFFHGFITSTGLGLTWLVPGSLLAPLAIQESRAALGTILAVAGFAVPLALFVRHQVTDRPRLPLISLLLILVNQVWLVSMPRYGSLVLGSVALFHGLQYMAILTVFHVRERSAGPNHRPWWRHAASFYVACLVLGYLLFQVWPQAYVLLGFTLAESVLLVIAVVNVHHFIVDAFIWRLRKDSNFATVASGAAAA